MGPGARGTRFCEPRLHGTVTTPGSRESVEDPEHRLQDHPQGRVDPDGDGDEHEHPDEDEHRDPGRAPARAVRTAARGELAGAVTPSAQGCTPRRRADRARWRLERIRRSRLTSIGSCARAAGVSMSALSSW